MCEIYPSDLLTGNEHLPGASTYIGTSMKAADWFGPDPWVGQIHGSLMKRGKAKKNTNAVRREGLGYYTVLPLWIDWGWKGGYPPLVLSIASVVGFCFI
jgi:hypothetical protein